MKFKYALGILFNNWSWLANFWSVNCILGMWPKRSTSIIYFCQGLSLVQVSISYSMWKLRFQESGVYIASLRTMYVKSSAYEGLIKKLLFLRKHERLNFVLFFILFCFFYQFLISEDGRIRWVLPVITSLSIQKDQRKWRNLITLSVP